MEFLGQYSHVGTWLLPSRHQNQDVEEHKGLELVRLASQPFLEPPYIRFLSHQTFASILEMSAYFSSLRMQKDGSVTTGERSAASSMTVSSKSTSPNNCFDAPSCSSHRCYRRSLSIFLSAVHAGTVRGSPAQEPTRKKTLATATHPGPEGA